MSKLHELLAVESDLEGSYKKIFEEAAHTFAKKPNKFMAFHKRYEPFEDGVDKQQPSEQLALDTTVMEKLEYVMNFATRYYDALLQKETTNQFAKSDITINGKTIAKDVPATMLLGLESRLKHIRNLIESVPTLPPGIEWKLDKAIGKNVYKRIHPEVKNRTQKQFKSQVLYDATEQHPAQIEKWEETVAIGKYITEHWSGMISSAEKSTLLARVDTLIRAIKKARQRANCQEVANVHIGKSLIGFILDR